MAPTQQGALNVELHSPTPPTPPPLFIEVNPTLAMPQSNAGVSQPNLTASHTDAPAEGNIRDVFHTPNLNDQ